jgi:small subunit ribosomal protein S13
MKIFYNIYKSKKQIPFYKQLQPIFGLGKFYTKNLILRLGYSKNDLHLVKNLNLNQIKALTFFVKDFLRLENYAKVFIADRLRFFAKIRLIKSFRFRWGLPVHGQRTRCNAKTAKRRAGKLNKRKKFKKR